MTTEMLRPFHIHHNHRIQGQVGVSQPIHGADAHHLQKALIIPLLGCIMAVKVIPTAMVLTRLGNTRER